MAGSPAQRCFHTCSLGARSTVSVRNLFPKVGSSVAGSFKTTVSTPPSIQGMSTYASVAGLQPRQIWDGVVASPLRGARITVGILEFEPLTQVPEHRHDNEQMGLVLKGSITMVIDGERRDLQVGGMYSIRG